MFNHVLFWTVYLGLCLYNELYISPSFLLNPTQELFIQVVFSVFILTSIKACFVYFILYKVLPLWNTERNILRFVLGTTLSVLTGALMLRIAMHHVIWPIVYRDSVPALNIFTLAARYIYSLLDLTQIAGVALSIKLYKLNIEKIRIEKSLLIEKNRTELQHLKSQTNPHFLFNTLNSLYALSRSKSDQAPDAIMRLSKILRYTLFDSTKNTIALGDEIKIIKDYVDLQQLRYADRIEFILKEETDNPQVQITPLLLLPLVENAYKHCDEDAATIFFEIKAFQGMLRVSTHNITSPNDPAQGSGLKNLKRQLNLLYGEYTYNYGISKNTFMLELKINLNTYSAYELPDS